MTPGIIGISSGLLIIFSLAFLKQLDKKLLYGLILAGIGFLYVGFVWTDLNQLVGNSIQAILFVFLAYYGVKRSIYILAAGYFLHGAWDLVYDLMASPRLIPPHYDWFCSTLDFTIGIYIVLFKRNFEMKSAVS